MFVQFCVSVGMQFCNFFQGQRRVRRAVHQMPAASRHIEEGKHPKSATGSDEGPLRDAA